MAALPRLLAGRSALSVYRANCYATTSTRESRHASSVTTSSPESSARPRPTIDRMIRVNQAGEFAANRIYDGQLSVLRDSKVGTCIEVSMEL